MWAKIPLKLQRGKLGKKEKEPSMDSREDQAPLYTK